MVRLVQLMSAALLALTLASPAAEAQTQTAKQSTGTHRHRAETKQKGRQVTVHGGTPSWLTLGNNASVGRGDNYVTSTFDQPSAVEGTFSGYRGRERLTNQYGVPGAPLFRF